MGASTSTEATPAERDNAAACAGVAVTTAPRRACEKERPTPRPWDLRRAASAGTSVPAVKRTR
ncbi:hypothetical protein AHiyo4_43220 [Arthrobacter sp. Hiyo4]|nr:hypothetical protein AHiyo4_43220 [Arthrobacter sp. Hiyo4]